MEFLAQKSDLLKELDLVQGVVEKKTTIPILSNVLLEFENLQLRLSATDQELGARCTCPAKAKTAGVVTVPARRLFEIVRSLPDAEIRFRVLENNWLQVNCGRSSFKLVGMAKDNFPTLPSVPKPQAKVAASLLRNLIDRTIFAISNEESRFTLNGALLVVKPTAVTMVATDGHRMALAEHRGEIAGLNGELRMLIPRKTMGELRRLLAESVEEANVEIANDDRHLFFSVVNRLLISRMLSGQFPNYEAVLPRENNKVVELDRELVSAALRRVAVLADERSHAVRVQLEKDRLEIVASGGEHGEASEVLDARNGEALKIGFNCEYLLDFFGVVGKAGMVLLELKDDLSAAEFRPTGEDDCQYRYVVMPMRV
jgi:DNA polymerase III subunit beta